jgi:hypothetical protein
LVDAGGVERVFVDKDAVLSSEPIHRESPFPVDGVLGCEVVSRGERSVQVRTAWTGAEDGDWEFDVGWIDLVGGRELDGMLVRLESTSGCVIRPRAGEPVLGDGIALPGDLAAFYLHGGGASLFPDADFGFDIVGPEGFVPATATVAGPLTEDDDRSRWWYVVARSDDHPVVIDLHPDRLGRSYDGFWDTYGLPGDMAVVARSFTELVDELLRAEGSRLHWLQPEWTPLGDAYD